LKAFIVVATMLGRGALCLGLAGLASGKIYFSETFGDGWENRWTVSKWKESEGTAVKWVASAGKWFANEAEDTGIQTPRTRSSSASPPASTLSATRGRN